MPKTQELLYAVVGAGDFAIEKAKGVSKVADRKVTQKYYKDFIKRGRSVYKTVKTAAPTKRAMAQTKTARTQVKAAATSVTKAVRANGKAASSAAKTTASRSKTTRTAKAS